MIFTTVGVGPGDPGLVTLKAIKMLEECDLVILPLSAAEKESVAEGIIGEYIKNAEYLRMVFPMTKDAAARDAKLREQLLANRALWERAGRVVMPVIGDAALYSTSAYLYGVWKEILPPLKLEIVPGISAHSAISSHVGRFLALGDDVLTIIPGTGDAEAVTRALSSADSAAIFKPIALREKLGEVVRNSGPWGTILRIDRAGLADERIVWGAEALEAPDEYLSTLMLWRD